VLFEQISSRQNPVADAAGGVAQVNVKVTAGG